MSRLLRLAGIALALPLLLGALGADDRRQDLERIEGWLNGLRSLRADFVQFAPDGGRATGKLLFKRPDKMRLDYDPPSPVLIIANGWEVTYYDRKLDQTSAMLTSATPLAFLLEDEISFAGDVTVTDFARADGQIRVTVVETGEEDEGSITLFFEQDPIALRRWAVTDAQGLTTHVVLDDVELDVPIEDDVFRFRTPRRGVGRGD
ncbi:MAG TPA: outer membrane lipoprotein carrier protein LolA [Geminicoccaceae bacterium]